LISLMLISINHGLYHSIIWYYIFFINLLDALLLLIIFSDRLTLLGLFINIIILLNFCIVFTLIILVRFSQTIIAPKTLTNCLLSLWIYNNHWLITLFIFGMALSLGYFLWTHRGCLIFICTVITNE